MNFAESPFSPHLAFAAVFISWLLSQLIKIARNMKQWKKFNFRWLFDTGGMPSSHSASVASLTTATGIYYGVWTMPFLIVLIFSLITMFDAAGVRRSVGRQAQVLNRMVDDLSEKGEVQEDRVKELLGHTPVEVFAGAFLGIMMSFVLCR